MAIGRVPATRPLIPSLPAWRQMRCSFDPRSLSVRRVSSVFSAGENWWTVIPSRSQLRRNSTVRSTVKYSFMCRSM